MASSKAGPKFDALAAEVQEAMDEARSGEQNTTIRLLQALESLKRAVEPTSKTVSDHRFRTAENICLMMAVEMGLIDMLVKHCGLNVTAAGLATETGYNETLIARVMRLVTAIGFCDETGYQTYTANEITQAHSDPGTRGSLVIANEFIFPAGQKLRQYLRENKPLSPEQKCVPYEYAVGESIWQTLKANNEWKEAFDDNMTTRIKLYATPWHFKYPAMEKLADVLAGPHASAVTIVDIGGSHGSDLSRFLQHHPNYPGRLILQDLPETFESMKTTLDTRIEQMPYDFFTRQPVEGAHIYYLKSVLHDWNDADSTRILSRVACVMNSDSRLLINEMVLADTAETAPRAGMDILMYLISDGMERTLTQWRNLVASVKPPLRILDVWSAPGDDQAVIEVALQD